MTRFPPHVVHCAAGSGDAPPPYNSADGENYDEDECVRRAMSAPTPPAPAPAPTSTSTSTSTSADVDSSAPSYYSIPGTAPLVYPARCPYYTRPDVRIISSTAPRPRWQVSIDIVSSAVLDALAAQALAKKARPAAAQPFRVSVCAAHTLNAIGQSRVTLSLWHERLRAACESRQEERGLKSAQQNDPRRPRRPRGALASPLRCCLRCAAAAGWATTRRSSPRTTSTFSCATPRQVCVRARPDPSRQVGMPSGSICPHAQGRKSAPSGTLIALHWVCRLHPLHPRLSDRGRNRVASGAGRHALAVERLAPAGPGPSARPGNPTYRFD